MKNAFALLLLPFAIGCVVHGSGKIETEEHDIGEPTHVSVCCGFEVIVNQGNESSLSITGDDNLLAEIIVEERRDEITIGFPETLSDYEPTEAILVELTLPDLREIDGDGGVNIRLENSFQLGELDVEISGGSMFQVEELRAKKLDLSMSGGGLSDMFGLELDELDVDASSGGWIGVHGRATRIEGEFSGGGMLDAFECNADHVELELSGGSEAKVRVAKTLDVDASGGSQVTYRGEPKVKKQLSGGSEIIVD